MKTIEILESERIEYVGVGRNANEVKQAVVIEHNGLRLVFFSYTFPETYVNSVIAGHSKAGCTLCDLKRIKEDINKGKRISDFVCISLHWGYQYCQYPSPEQIDLARNIVDAGADLIIGHHPHVLQGYERYKHGVIFYSLGNFFFPDFWLVSGIFHKHRRECNELAIARCVISKRGVEDFEILSGFRNKNFQLVLYDGKRKQKAIERIEKLCAGMERTDYTGFWEACRKKAQEVEQKALIKNNIRYLFGRARELGIMACVRKITFRRIRYIIKSLFKLWKL